MSSIVNASVAIATYNGEKYIKEQIESILKQTCPVAQIVVSDDGSTDCTLTIVEELIPAAEAAGVSLTIRTDNPRHGIGGNFEWAIRHCTGEYIFICGQDDIWLPEKVERVARIFSETGADMVCHRLQLVDSHGKTIINRIPGSVFEKMALGNNQVFHAQRKDYLERSVSSVLCPGPSVCITRQLAEKTTPIPTHHAEDGWLQFCAVAEDGLFYLHEVLTNYRVHDSASHSAGMNWRQRLQKIWRRVKNASRNRNDLLRLAQAMLDYLNHVEADSAVLASAQGTAKRLYEIGSREVEASASGRISGAYMLTKMYCTDMRYRRNGFFSFLTHLGNILLFSKAKRCKDLGLPKSAE